MNDQQDDWDTLLANGLQLHSLVWGIVGNDLPEDLGRCLMTEVNRLGDVSERTDESASRIERLLHIRDGLLAAYYD